MTLPGNKLSAHTHTQRHTHTHTHTHTHKHTHTHTNNQSARSHIQPSRLLHAYTAAVWRVNSMNLWSAMGAWLKLIWGVGDIQDWGQITSWCFVRLHFFLLLLPVLGRLISRVSDQNGVPLLYIILEIHHSGWEPSICSLVMTTYSFDVYSG